MTSFHSAPSTSAVPNHLSLPTGDHRTTPIPPGQALGSLEHLSTEVIALGTLRTTNILSAEKSNGLSKIQDDEPKLLSLDCKAHVCGQQGCPTAWRGTMLPGEPQPLEATCVFHTQLKVLFSAATQVAVGLGAL